jgi:hypothetical protein
VLVITAASALLGAFALLGYKPKAAPSTIGFWLNGRWIRGRPHDFLGTQLARNEGSDLKDFRIDMPSG